jgi:hypothetical protein
MVDEILPFVKFLGFRSERFGVGPRWPTDGIRKHKL